MHQHRREGPVVPIASDAFQAAWKVGLAMLYPYQDPLLACIRHILGQPRGTE